MSVVSRLSPFCLVIAIAACSGSSSPPATQSPAAPVAGSTGAFGIVTVGGKQKMYLPQSGSDDAGNAFIAVVDVGVVGNGVAGAPALVKNIDLGTTNYATTTGGDASMVVAASTRSNDVWFIDPTTDTLVGHITLDATYGTSEFSGGGGYVTGIAVDEANNRALLSVWNGVAVVDLGSMAVTGEIQAPPSENFGFDAAHQLVLLPFYDCTNASDPNDVPPATCNDPLGPDGVTVMGAGLNVVDLTDDTVYTYEDPTAEDPNNPLGGEPDSAATDPASQIYIVPGEGDYENILDFSKATFDKTNDTVTAPHAIVTGLSFEGVAVEPSSHLAFWESEGDTDVAIADLTQANGGNQGYVQGTMPELPNAAGDFSNLGDPHGIAVTTSITNGNAVGFVVDSGLQWVARVDLKGFAALEESDASVLAGTTQMQAVVTYLDATTAE